MITLKKTIFTTPLGEMISITDENVLYLLAFSDQLNLEKTILTVSRKINFPISMGKTIISKKIQEELKNYFCGKKITFETPIFPTGTAFQKMVWGALQRIPFGETRSYENIAHAINKPLATRAVANAIKQNIFSIIIPCHRVIHKNGRLGGYNSGVERKKWLLESEQTK